MDGFYMYKLADFMKHDQFRQISLPRLLTVAPAGMSDASKGSGLLRRMVLALTLTGLSGVAGAVDLPNAGSQMQQIPQAPAREKQVPQIRIKQGDQSAVTVADQTKFVVKTLQVTGAQAFAAADLVEAAGLVPGKEVTLGDLYAMAGRISDHYHRNGYFLARAVVPPQEIQDDTVTISVLEGHYGKIALKNSTNLSPNLAGSLLAGVGVGNSITSAPLEHSLLLLSDLPGVEVKSTLVPGASVGASDLIVEVTPGRRVTGSLDADNSGNRYTGATRIGVTVNVNEPAGYGDVLTLRGLGSTSGGLLYGRAAYQMQFGKAKAGVALAGMHYELGSDFASLEAHGKAEIVSVYGSYPILRSRGTNLYAQFGFDAKTFQDKMDSNNTVADKEAGVWMLSLNGDSRDGLGGDGYNRYSVTLTDGKIDLRSAGTLATDATTARTNGHFNKLSISATRVQFLPQDWSLYATVNGQVASKNLDSSEKMELGGAGAVRAYPEGEAYGDQGYVVNLEAHRALPKLHERLPGRMEAIGFIDTGSVTLNHTAWTSNDNRRTLSGAGLGLNWAADNDFVVKAYYARKLGNAEATSAPDSAHRFWLQAVKYF